MKLFVIILALVFSIVNAVVSPPSGLPVGVKSGGDWEKDLNERMSTVLKTLEEFRENVRMHSTSSHKSHMRGRLSIDLRNLRDMLQSDNKSTLKRREEKFGEICDTWMKYGVIGGRFERWVGVEDGPFLHLAFCIPSEN